MSDLGFGLVDKRTVAAVLFTFALVSALGLRIPVDVNNVGQLFVYIVLLTGYVYFVRSVWRLPLVVYSAIRARRINRFLEGWKIFDQGYWIPVENMGSAEKVWRLVNIIDRLSVIASILIASLPAFSGIVIVTVGGTAGIVLMLAVYILTGGFTFLVRDAVDAAQAEPDVLT